MIRITQDPLVGVEIVVACCGKDVITHWLKRRYGIKADGERDVSGYCDHYTRKNGGELIVVWIDSVDWDESEGPSTIAHEVFHLFSDLLSIMYGTDKVTVDTSHDEEQAYLFDRLHHLVWDVVRKTTGTKPSDSAKPQAGTVEA
ncbi:MAG: hypothetical protein WC096_00880 [Sphaerochaetaceae bacterium]